MYHTRVLYRRLVNLVHVWGEKEHQIDRPISITGFEHAFPVEQSKP